MVSGLRLAWACRGCMGQEGVPAYRPCHSRRQRSHSHHRRVCPASHRQMSSSASGSTRSRCHSWGVGHGGVCSASGVLLLLPHHVPQQHILVPSPAPTPPASIAHSHIHDDDHVLGRRGPLDIPAQEKPQLGPASLRPCGFFLPSPTY